MCRDGHETMCGGLSLDYVRGMGTRLCGGGEWTLDCVGEWTLDWVGE